MKRLRAGVIGLGVGEQHAAAFDQLEDCELAAICDFDPARLSAVGARFPSARPHRHADELLNDPSIDVVAIASYDDAHAGQVLDAIRAGKHVFAEKPLCTRADECQAIRAALSDHPDIRLTCNLILRLSPRLQLLKQMIHQGEFGTLFHVEGDYNYGRLQKITEGWRGRLPFYSVVMGGAVHMVDTLPWLTGEHVVEVSAYGNRIASSEARSDFAHSDMVVAALRFANGMVGKITANFGCVMPHGHGLSLYGTKATFINGAPDGLLYTSRDPALAPRRITARHPGAGKGDLIAGFVDSILHRAEPIIPVEQVLQTTVVCLAIEQSQQEGRPVALDAIGADEPAAALSAPH